MTISFRSASQTSSAECLLQREPLLSPPASHHSLEDVPFKPKESDHTSLNMKRRKKYGLGVSREQRPRAFHYSQQDIHGKSQIRQKKPTRSFRRTSLPRSISLPLLQPRFTHGTIELLSNVNLQQRHRRWTVPTKAASTRGLAPIIPLEQRDDKRHPSDESLLQSPAMITLRRATTSNSLRRMSLTSFPPPKFGRISSGFLSSLLNSITYKEQGSSNLQPPFYLASAAPLPPRSASISSNEAQPCISTAAPVVCTELIMMESQGPNSNPGHSLYPVRRCSTRFVSDNSVYEILWDEDSSSTSSEALTVPKIARHSSSMSRRSSAVDGLQFQLSRASTRRGSLQVPMTGGGSGFYDDENLSQSRFPGVGNSPSARFVNGKGFHNLPRSTASQAMQLKSCVNQSQEDGVSERQQAHSNGNQVELFPPLGSRASTRKSRNCPDSPANSCNKDPNGNAGTNPSATRNHCTESLDVRTHAKLEMQQKDTSNRHQRSRVSAGTIPSHGSEKESERRGKSSRLCTSAASPT